jgi:2-polyprenyl-3-methyl-5-hydroxy-6-metoxy-1,4-benzoquinol methylase
MKQLTFRRALSLVELPDNARVLELGCGGGDFAELALSLGYSYFGVDLNSEAIERVSERCPSAELHCGTIETLSKGVGLFDVVVMFDFLEHVRDPRAELQLIRNFLRNGGMLVVSTPRTDSWSRRVLRFTWPQYREEHLILLSSTAIQDLGKDIGLDTLLIHKTRKYVTMNYLRGQLVSFTPPVFGNVLKFIWRFLPLPKSKPFPMFLGEMTWVAKNGDSVLSQR